ncbi:LysM domain-containing protein [Ectobacillus funiculus]|uniref:LysM peptidoglycan-binding domain-containing protein n=1 Tax=Ectobacillus funiculus TaxID=137993 RepID=UPI00397E7E5A
MQTSTIHTTTTLTKDGFFVPAGASRKARFGKKPKRRIFKLEGIQLKFISTGFLQRMKSSNKKPVLRRALTGFVFVSGLLVYTHSEACECGMDIAYQVQPGDSPSKLASYYQELSWQRVLDVNQDKLNKKGQLVAGTVITLPPAEKLKVNGSNYITQHQVDPDSLYIPASQEPAVTPTASPMIQQQAQQPIASPVNATKKTILDVSIKKGETVSELAAFYNATLQDIAAANPGLNLNKVRANQIIKIPSDVTVVVAICLGAGDDTVAFSPLNGGETLELIPSRQGIDYTNEYYNKIVEISYTGDTLIGIR